MTEEGSVIDYELEELREVDEAESAESSCDNAVEALPTHTIT
jgi:hypothetical protein